MAHNMRKRYVDFSEDVEDDSSENFLPNSSRGREHDKNRANSIQSVSTRVAIGVLLTLLALFGLVHYIDGRLPTPLTLKDEITYPDAFITERAHHDLKLLTQYGSRVAGSYENEELTVDFLKRELSFIVQRAHANQLIEIDHQIVSGSHYLDLGGSSKIGAYANIQNVVVKLHSKESTDNSTRNSLLVNSHFDSVPTSPGGSDDGISVVTMLELLRKLSRSSTRPTNNVILLFNGAEETGFQAAHGFITQHKWAKECSVVLNLEAAGAGGKLILFQTGPSAPWLLDYYRDVPHPYGSAAGEEIFQSGIIPSDTDFRIFRDSGGLIGYDTAFFKNGYRYHTKYDDVANIPLGSFQQAGDNVLHLVKRLAEAPELRDAHLRISNSNANVVYFDYLGLFMVSYNQIWAMVLNYGTVCLSVMVFLLSLRSFKLNSARGSAKYLGLTFGAVFGGWILAFISVGAVAHTIDGFGLSMSWYRTPWLIFGLYCAPTIGVASILIPLISKEGLSPNVKAQVQAHTTRLIWTLLLLIGTIAKIRTTYAILVPVLFNTLAFALIQVFKLQHSVRKWQIVYAISLIVPTIFSMYEAMVTLCLFVPVTGRIGPDKNVELIIGLMTSFFTILITCQLVAVVNLVKNVKVVILSLGGVFLVFLFLVAFTPLGFPYSGNQNSPAPQRYWIVHSRRIFHNETGHETKRDSGYYLLNMDRNSPQAVRGHVDEINRAKDMEDDCQKYLLCGLPVAHPKMISIIEYSSWIPAGQPLISAPLKLESVNRIRVSDTVIRYEVKIEGPDRIAMFLSPLTGVEVRNFSLIAQSRSDLDPVVGEWNRRKLYYIGYTWGKESAPLEFSFNVDYANKTDFDPTDASQYIFAELALTGVYVHENVERKVPHFEQFLASFPEWADVTPYLGAFESWFI